MKPLVLPATMMPVRRLKDGSCTITMTTLAEMSTEQFSHIDSYRQMNGYLLFASNKETLPPVPEEDAKAKRTASQELRFELLRLHLAKGGTEQNFPAYYAQRMTGFRERIKNERELLDGI